MGCNYYICGMELEEYFVRLIEQTKSYDIANAEFRRLLADDPAMQHEYTAWCQERGSSERTGFRDFWDEYIDSQRDIFDTLTDYDDDTY